MTDNKEKIYSEQKSLPGSESSVSPQDNGRGSDINNEIDSVNTKLENADTSIVTFVKN